MNLPFTNGDESWELPIPATFIVDRDGTHSLRIGERGLHRAYPSQRKSFASSTDAHVRRAHRLLRRKHVDQLFVPHPTDNARCCEGIRVAGISNAPSYSLRSLPIH